MKASVLKRIEQIKAADEPSKLKKCLCPFFEKGGHPDSLTCRKDDESLEECRDYYLEHIRLAPMDIYDPSFDVPIYNKREEIRADEIVGIGINCNNCYMYDKCPLYKKDYVCGIKWDSNKPQTPEDFMDFLVNVQYERVQRSSVFEKIDGGVPDASVSGELDRLQSYVLTKIDMGRERLSLKLEATGAAAGGNSGILSKIFGGGAIGAPKVEALPEPKTETIDFTEIKEKEPIKRKDGKS